MDRTNTNYKVGEIYYANKITDGEFHGIYDWLIASVDGKLEHLSDWHSEVQSEFSDENTEAEAHDMALTDITHNIWVAYEGAKHIAIFRGIAPRSGGFDVYARYECISNERAD